MQSIGDDAHAREAIRRLLSLYCDAVARRDPEVVGSLVTSDARVRIAGGEPRCGRDAIVSGLRRTLGDFSFLHQKCDTGLIDVSGDSAHARIGVMEFNQRIGASELNLIFGFYEDRYARTGDGWRFADRDFTLQFRAVLPTADAGLMQALAPAEIFLPLL